MRWARDGSNRDEGATAGLAGHFSPLRRLGSSRYHSSSLQASKPKPQEARAVIPIIKTVVVAFINLSPGFLAWPFVFNANANWSVDSAMILRKG